MSDRLHLVLASASPRRRELLGSLGFPVVCEPAAIDESSHADEPPACHVLRVAREKAVAVAARHPESPVLGADTSVVLGTRIMGKPGDRREAREMLAALSGRSHRVFTGMCVSFRGRVVTHLESAAVTFRDLTPELSEWYLATGEGDDKAGAYAVQGVGGVLVTRVEGNVQAVIGLPLAPLLDLLRRSGIAVVADGAALVLLAAPSG